MKPPPSPTAIITPPSSASSPPQPYHHLLVTSIYVATHPPHQHHHLHTITATRITTLSQPPPLPHYRHFTTTSKGVFGLVITTKGALAPPLVTSNMVLFILAIDYPVDKVSCNVFDDGAAMLLLKLYSKRLSLLRNAFLNGNELPRLVYVSCEKRHGFQHHKKAGAMNASSVTWEDNWTTLMLDGNPTAQLEHMILITKTGQSISETSKIDTKKTHVLKTSGKA
nr:cellulose synthase [Tanacetum cinerariifolium]